MALSPSTPAPSLDLPRLQSELARLVRHLQDDLRQRCEQQEAVNAPLLAEYQQARQAQRSSEAFAPWRECYLGQVAVAWVLASLFLRYLEDNGLLDEVWLSGLGAKRSQAEERYSAYFRKFPEHSDRDYFHYVFDQLAQLPGCGELFGREHTPLWKVGLSGDGAQRLRSFWWDIDPNRGAWSLEGADTRFLGDLYQNLSEEARSRFALLQTPDFVERFILDRTLEPAIRDFGLEEVRLIDPTCGSGHFLLGAFERLLGHWRKRSTENPRVLARKALEAVHGIDINPFAVAIARFRLVLAFLRACGFSRMKDMPDIHPRVASGDSLLFARQVDRLNNTNLLDWLPEPFAVGDYEQACQILSQRYHAVVGNPPYITDKDKRHNEVVRSLYYSCHRQFSLGVPFTERFFDLTVAGARAGYVGMITTNSFMKREFGKKLIEEVLPRLDLTHVLDTSGAYIPGHGTPTVILLGRHRPPLGPSVRAVLGIRGESATPAVPADGLVWTSIVSLVDGQHGDQNAHVSVADVDRATFSKHPWSIGGGGAAELKERIEGGRSQLEQVVEKPIGRAVRIAQEDCFMFDAVRKRLSAVPDSEFRGFLIGEEVRDWSTCSSTWVWYPYLENSAESQMLKHLWRFKTLLAKRTTFNGTLEQLGLPWYEYQQHTASAYRTPLSIAFAEVATHNHFVLDRGGKVFKQTAPIIKLPEGATEEEHLALLGLLNSSIGNFWTRQVCFAKGGDYVGNEGARVIKTPWDDRLQRAATSLQQFPLAASDPRTLRLARQLDALAQEFAAHEPGRVSPTREALEQARQRQLEIRSRMIALQEELDWLSYELYGILDQAPLAAHPEDLNLGERAFEMAMARAQEDTTWFTRHRSTPITELPAHWSPEYRGVVEKRLEWINHHPEIRLLERPEHKRRWQSVPWEERVQEALQTWLLDRLEQKVKQHDQLLSATRLADEAGRDAEFLAVLALYRGRDDLHLVSEVTELVTPQAVPFLAAWRYTDSGLRIRSEWEQCWELQRRQDAGENLDIAVPPKYASKDFRRPHYWSLRGKLDVPKERFIHYPGAEREADPSLVLGWAGWNHLQRAQALATYLLERKEGDGWDRERLHPLLAGLAELLPWLKQWHNEVDPESGERLGDYYESFLREEARSLGLTLEAVRSWRPAETAGRGKGKKS